MMQMKDGLADTLSERKRMECNLWNGICPILWCQNNSILLISSFLLQVGREKYALTGETLEKYKEELEDVGYLEGAVGKISSWMKLVESDYNFTNS